MNTASLQKAALRDLDLAWVIALYKAIHGGDFFDDPAITDVSELLARGLVGHLAGPESTRPSAVVENLARLNIKVSVKAVNGKTEIKTTNDLRMLIEDPEQHPPRTICVLMPGFGEFCWTPRCAARPSE